MRGLKILVNYHQYTGISYLAYNFGAKMSYKKKIIITLLNLILFAFLVNFWFEVVSDTINTSLNRNYHEESKKANMIFILSTIGFIGYVISMTYVFVVLLVNGKYILEYLHKQDMKIQSKIELKIGIKVVVCQIVITLLVEFMYPISRLIFGGITNYPLKKRLIMFVCSIFLENILATLISLIAYYCYYIEEYIHELEKNFNSLSQTRLIYYQAIKVRNSVTKFNEYFKKSIFMLIMLSSICCVTNATIFYFNRGTEHTYTIASIFEYSITIFIICTMSNKIEASYKKLLDKFDKLELLSSRQKSSCLYYSLVNKMYSMRDDMCFTAFDLYKIDNKIFMQIVSLIVTFCVIIIQT